MHNITINIAWIDPEEAFYWNKTPGAKWKSKKKSSIRFDMQRFEI